MPRIQSILRLPGSGSRIFQMDLGSPAIGGVADVHAAVTDDGTEQTITADLTNPPTPRVISATSAGVTDDIKDIQVVVHGTNFFDEIISETLPVFSLNSATTVIGVKAFKTVTSFVIPAHDGNGATTSLGLGDILGLPVELVRDSVLVAYLTGILEGTRPTVTIHASNIEANTIDLNSALDGSAVLVDFFEPAT